MSKLRTWETNKYYQLARQGSQDNNHPGIRTLQKISLLCNSILDLGCGEGTRVINLCKKNQSCTGIDISQTAIKLAKQNSKKINFVVGDLEKLPFENNTFELVYSNFVLEHITNPEKVISESIRVTATNGFILFLAPNFGAPNRCSPVFKGSRIKKIIAGFIKDFVFWNGRLEWNQVTPNDNPEQYEIDLDTTVEPYIGSLIKKLKTMNIEIIEYSSCWEMEQSSPKLTQKIFRFLSSCGVYPFYLWGPHLFVLGRKR